MTTPSLSVRTHTLETLRQMLRSGLQSGAWPVGSRLPTERALCEEHGLSRSAVRRVLDELSREKLIARKVGSGTYVTALPAGASRAPARNPHALAVPSVSPAELMEARLLLEPVMVELIVNNATMEDFAHLGTCCLRAEDAQTQEEFEHWDTELHRELALATHNAVFVSIFQLLADLRSSPEWGALKNKALSPERRHMLEREHRRIVQALERRDADTARRAIFDHLAEAREKLLWRIRSH